MEQAVIPARRKRRPRNPEATREVILEAAQRLLAEGGPEGLSLSAVAHAAGVNRGTAYQHFESREKLIDATIASVSESLLRAVYGDPASMGERKVEDIDLVQLTETLAEFAMDNPDLCRVWLLQVLASPDPSNDPFWRGYSGLLARFAETDLSRPGIDAEVMAIIGLAGTFMWPVLAHAGDLSDAERKQSARRFSRELLRLSLHGSVAAEKLPGLLARVA